MDLHTPDSDSGHARLSMSRLPRIIDCPGSIPLFEDYCIAEGPQEERQSAHANRGTFQHEVVADLLTREVYEVTTILAPETEEHLSLKANIETVLDIVREEREKWRAIDPSFVDFVETKASLKGFAFNYACELLKEVEGTCDYCFFIKNGTELHVWDWKFGHILVYPDSDQLIGYAAGKLKNFEFAIANVNKVVLHIVQPSAEDSVHKTYELSTADILRWIKHTLVPALEKTSVRPYILNTTEKACQFCPMKVRCSARRDANLRSAEKAFAIYAQMPGILDLDEIAEALRIFESVDKYKKDLLKFAYLELSNGRTFPGRKIVQKGGRRAWVNEHKAVAVLEEQGIELEDISEIKVYSPVKVEKVLGRKRAKEKWFVELCPKGAGSLTLVKDSDPRPAVDFGQVGDRFSEFLSEEDIDNDTEET